MQIANGQRFGDIQIWIRELVDAASGLFRLSAWRPYDSDSQQNFNANMYVTRDDTRGGNRALQYAFVQPTDGLSNSIPNTAKRGSSRMSRRVGT